MLWRASHITGRIRKDQGKVKEEAKIRIRAWSGDGNKSIQSPEELQNSQMAYTQSLTDSTETYNINKEIRLNT